MIETVFGTTTQSKPLQVSAASVMAALETLKVEKDYIVMYTSNGVNLPFDHAIVQLVEAKRDDGGYAVAVEHFAIVWDSPKGIVVGFAKNLTDTDNRGYVCDQEGLLVRAEGIWNFLLTGEKPANCDFVRNAPN